MNRTELQTRNLYNMRAGREINAAIADLPTAQLCEFKAIVDKDSEELVKNWRVIRVTQKNGRVSYVDAPTSRYALVQHEAAFRPVVEGLTLAGVKDFSFLTLATDRHAEMQIYVDSAGYDSVSLGFKVSNSFNRSKALSFGFTLNKSQKYIEIVGYRQACANGLMIRVPLEQAEIIRPEARIKLETLMEKKTRLKHTESIHDKLQAIQYIVEALALLRNPVENMIKKGQAWKIEHDELLKSLVKSHVAKRYQQKVMEQYKRQVADGEGNDLWQLTNALTWVASHDPKVKEPARKKLMEASANLLLMATH